MNWSRRSRFQSHVWFVRAYFVATLATLLGNRVVAPLLYMPDSAVGTLCLSGCIPCLGLLLLARTKLSNRTSILAWLTHFGVDLALLLDAARPASSTSGIGFVFWPYVSFVCVVIPAFLVSMALWNQKRTKRAARLRRYFRQLANAGMCTKGFRQGPTERANCHVNNNGSACGQ